MLNHYWLYSVYTRRNEYDFVHSSYTNINPLLYIVDRDKHILTERKCGHFHKRFSVPILYKRYEMI